MSRNPLRNPCEPICYQWQCARDVCSSLMELPFRFFPLRQWMVISNFLPIISSQELLQTSLGNGRKNIKKFSQLCKKFQKRHTLMLMPLLASFHVRRKHGAVLCVEFAAVNYVLRTPKKALGTLLCPIPGLIEHQGKIPNWGKYKEMRWI